MSSPVGSAAAPVAQMVRQHATFELAQLLRNGEQLLLTIVIPILLLVLPSEVNVIDLGTGKRIDFLAPGVLALAVLSTAFTAQAIGTGFERRYGLLKWLGATPLPRWGLLAGKTLAVLMIELGQLVLLGLVAVLLGWRPALGAWWAVFLALLLGTAAFCGLALLIAGTLRAESTLAVANLVYLLLLVGGDIVIPLTKFPVASHGVLGWLPSTALADSLRTAFVAGDVRWGSLGVLLVWAVVAITAAARWFRWE